MKPASIAAVRHAVAWTVLSALAIACGGSTSTASADGGNAPGCPATAPSAKDGCNTPGLQCAYGCAVTATCSGGSWQSTESNVGCAIDSGTPIDAAATCSTNADCTSGFQCTPGGTIVGCGVCAMPVNPCSTDADCALVDAGTPATSAVCAPAMGCTCPVNGKSGSCIPACTSASDCTPDEACAASGHCEPKPCTSDAQCPGTSTVDFACAGGVCGIKTCQSNADCGTHFCVSGTCSPEAGMCSIPPA